MTISEVRAHQKDIKRLIINHEARKGNRVLEVDMSYATFRNIVIANCLKEME